MANTKIMSAVLTTVQGLLYATAIFYHDPSSEVFQGLGVENNSDSGFAYTKNASKTLEFNKTWVEAAPYSKLDTSLGVSWNCMDDYCNPNLSILDLEWSGSEPYLLGSSANETVKITVQNTGNASYGACVWYRLYGAPLGQEVCQSYNKGYRCYLPNPLRRNTNYSIDLELNLRKPTNLQYYIRVEMRVYENCTEESVYKKETKKIKLDLSSNGVFNIGYSHRLNITDKQILENTTIYDHLEFPIINNGSIEWMDAEFAVMMAKEPYINSFNISTADCSTKDLKTSTFIIYHCNLDVLPNTTYTIIGTTEILAGRLNGYRNGTVIKIDTSSILYLDNRVSYIKVTSTTTITIQKDIRLGSQKWPIAVIVALIILAILTIILTIILCKRRNTLDSEFGVPMVRYGNIYVLKEDHIV